MEKIPALNGLYDGVKYLNCEDKANNELRMINTLNQVLVGLDLDAQCILAKQNKHMAFYDLTLNPGCKVRRIESSAPEIALALRSRTEPIIKIIPEKGIVRLHVVTKEADFLYFDDIYNQENIPDNYLIPFLLGESDEGKKLWTDMSKNPHMLVAGGTGSGKSVFLHLLISNVKKLNDSGNYDIALYLSDPKRVEFNKYKNHESEYNIQCTSDTYENTILMLYNIEETMNSIYEYFCEIGISTVEEAPKNFKKHIVIIDEVSDLMIYDRKSKRFETIVSRLAQKARAAGIYLILSTQRPSTDVLTGVIKANFPARLTCKVSSKIDSRVIMDRSGGENLLGRGDAILKNYDNDYIRFQVALSK